MVILIKAFLTITTNFTFYSFSSYAKFIKSTTLAKIPFANSTKKNMKKRVSIN